jgi:hypothetical protein
VTICIAALAENETKLVLAADHMVTASIPFQYEFERDDVPKIIELTPAAYLLASGNILSANEIAQQSMGIIKTGNIAGIEQIAEAVRSCYQTHRRTVVTRTFLEPRGLDIAGYNNLQQKLHVGIVQEINNQLSNFNIGVEFILAGHTENKCSIYTITHPGNLTCHNPIGYICIGSGGPHATYFLIGSNYRKNLPVDKVKSLVEEAKRRSEVAPGVGKQTTIRTLDTAPKEVANGRIPREPK